ncbi:hypothetical protein PTTG_28072 [Puccinia triticina 1-1 BBBD Race 1]|uniref:Helicase ATP-binding domain-containing protein n=1 Tax=Puccinia triticina (isolate 1-1 / race 1 (BBBD)) TaxID=630390 RepID=A0A180GFL4_PUCT1|nr:hypothetical protein PTTG_28072 [Puccinia triticina 1-1 BBBD Race 1]
MEKYSSRGSLLADDMGLGKMLTTLALILATSHLAKKSQIDGVQNLPVQSAATLVICPLATLSNWENELKIHFVKGALPYCIFHGRERRQIQREDLLSSLVVLTTYEMVGTSGNPLHTNQITIESLDVCWFRIVLDEAHMIRNPTANRTVNIQKLQSKFILCLTGTPFQNRLADVQSLISLLKISPWDQEWTWKKHLIPGMNVGSQDAITTMNRLMETICLRRTKDVLLNLSSKVEKVVIVSLGEPWEDLSTRFHQTFIQCFGRLRLSGEPWDSTEFFRQLTMIRQFCNHPTFARHEIHFTWNRRWQDSAKLVHLVENLNEFLQGKQGVQRPKAVIFSSFVAYLEM